MTKGPWVMIGGRVYPSGYTPGAHWATDEAWRILDQLPQDALRPDQRAFLAGQIAAAVMNRAEKEPLHSAPHHAAAPRSTNHRANLATQTRSSPAG